MWIDQCGEKEGESFIFKIDVVFPPFSPEILNTQSLPFTYSSQLWDSIFQGSLHLTAISI